MVMQKAMNAVMTMMATIWSLIHCLNQWLLFSICLSAFYFHKDDGFEPVGVRYVVQEDAGAGAYGQDVAVAQDASHDGMRYRNGLAFVQHHLRRPDGEPAFLGDEPLVGDHVVRGQAAYRLRDAPDEEHQAYHKLAQRDQPVVYAA